MYEIFLHLLRTNFIYIPKCLKLLTFGIEAFGSALEIVNRTHIIVTTPRTQS